MRLKENFAIREIAGTWVVLPLANSTLNFNGMINLNETGALLWGMLEKGADFEQLSTAIIEEYDIDREKACADVELFVRKLRTIGCIEE